MRWRQREQRASTTTSAVLARSAASCLRPPSTLHRATPPPPSNGGRAGYDSLATRRIYIILIHTLFSGVPQCPAWRATACSGFAPELFILCCSRSRIGLFSCNISRIFFLCGAVGERVSGKPLCIS
ncbi:hypothetical protein B0H12DRAFT_1136395 [Mycena haematopus]|nr:hypothetical protein B0H12DRAFT_1136395 [Mycena haematopus]